MNELFRTLLNLAPQASSVAPDIDALHYVIISTSLLGWALVVCATAVFLYRWRHGAAHARARAAYRGLPVWTEVVVIAGLLSMFLGFWVIGHAQYVRLATPPEDSLDVYVVGKQWMWSFAHADGAASEYDLYVPVGRPMRLLITSRDVVHSFFVPAFRVKQDAVPGRMTVIWFEATRPGVYPIFCAEYCGLSHSMMRGRVHVLEPAQFERWRRERSVPPALLKNAPLLDQVEAPAPAAELANLAAIGARVAADHGCLRCHSVDGTPHLGPTWARLYGSQIPLEDGSTTIADDAYLTRSMMDPMAEIHRDYPRIMPSYLGILDAAEVGALVAYIHSLADWPSDEVGAPMPEPTEGPIELPRTRDGLPPPNVSETVP